MDGHGSSSILFENTINHEGNGYADFVKFKIRVEGYVKIAINESGESTVLMEMQNIIVDGKPNDPDMVQILLKKSLDTREFAYLIKYIRLIERDRCSRLIVDKGDGIFSAESEDNVLCYYNGSQLVFSFLKSQFTASRDSRPKYWMLPLQNFVSNFSRGSPNVMHPLRINNSECRVIKFDFNGKLGFIEPLSDYSRRKEELQNGSIRNRVTALMIGEIGDSSIEVSDLGKWFPFDFLGILSLATGSEVSASWIEFRGQEGELVRRIYPRFKIPCFSKGHIAIDEFFNIGIGSLLTNFQFFPDRGDSLKESYFTAVLENLVKGGLHSLTSEDKLSHIFRGLDCLCERYQLKEKDLRNDLDLEQRKEVENAVKDAIIVAEKRLSILENDARTNGKEPQGDAIRAIFRKMQQNQPYFDRAYGRAVVNLIHKFCLNDVEVVESYYESNPRWDRT